MDQYVSIGSASDRLGMRRHFFLVPCYRLLAWGLLIPLMCVGCSPDSRPNSVGATVDDSGTNHPPSIRFVSITPSPLVLNGPVFAEVDAEDADGNPLTYRYRWLVNGNVLRDVTTSSLSPNLLKRGDHVSAEVIASDGQAETPAYESEPVVVKNTIPIVNRVSLEFDRSAGQGLLKARVEAVDPDGDDIQYLFRWWHNDKLVKENSEDIIDTMGFARKDTIVVEVFAHDQEGDALPSKSAPATVGNASPQILSNPSPLSSQNLYDYHVEAKDSDGDQLSYSLEIAPPGMTIDKTSGQISWNVSPGSIGTHRVKVTVDDGQGGIAWQEFEISIPPTPPAASSVTRG